MMLPSHKNGHPGISNEKRDALLLLIIVLCNLVLKAIPAGILELSNDEVYYWTYALFPDWSHFDHPPMVGFLIQLFTLNLNYSSELFIRAGSLVLSSANIIILFSLVKRLFSRRAAHIAVLLYISSIYFNIISGLFILPDSPQIFFVILAIYFLLPSVTIINPVRKDEINIILFGIFTGLAFLSKYHSLFLWLGAGLYIGFRNRIWLRKASLYLSLLLTLILTLPVFYWNFRNDFISFAFHSNRLGLLHSHVNLSSFFQFNLGEILYQNPVVFVIILGVFFKTFFSEKYKFSEVESALLFLGIPLILIFTIFSLFRTTLPHWSGPAFICLIIFASKYLAELVSSNRKMVISSLTAAAFIFAATLVFGTIQIKTGFIRVLKGPESNYPGQNDFTLDMYGWRQARIKFEDFLKDEGVNRSQYNHLAIVSDNWFPAAHLDYYIAKPLNIRLLALGDISKIHKYFWINKTRKLDITDRVLFITDSRNYQSPEKFRQCFSDIIPADTLTITRSGKIAKYVYLYFMEGLKCDTILYSAHPGF